MPGEDLEEGVVVVIEIGDAQLDEKECGDEAGEEEGGVGDE